MNGPAHCGPGNELLSAWQPAASTTFDGAFNFIVPPDYNQSVDILTVAIQIANSTTNTTAITATAYVKATATALSSVVTGTTSVTAPVSSNGITLYSTFAGKGLKPGQSLWIILTNSAHTTDAVSIYGMDMQYASITAWVRPARYRNGPGDRLRFRFDYHPRPPVGPVLILPRDFMSCNLRGAGSISRAGSLCLGNK